MPGPVVTPPPALPPEPTPPSLVVDSGVPRLPAIPSVIGPLEVRLVYPPEGATLGARDSNFVFGSVGSGAATLTVNGTPVRVEPNGSFLAFLPVPPGPQGQYDLMAIQGADTQRLTQTVIVPRARVDLADSRLLVDSTSLTPAGRLALERWEPVRVSIRAARDATVELQLADGSRLPMVSDDSGAPEASRDSYRRATEVPAVRLNSTGWVAVTRGADSVRLPLPRIALADSAGRRYASLGAAPSTVPDTDRVIIGRPIAGGTYKWFLLPGTIVEVTGRNGSAARVRLDRDLQVFVDTAELAMLPVGAAPPRRVASNARVVADGEWSDVRIPVTNQPPYAIEADATALVLTLYGTQANTDIINYPSTDPIIRRVTWRQVSEERAEYRIELYRPPFGYLVLWERGALVVRVRRPPRIDRVRPLAGLTIAVDAGHPPGGATGPTGLYEPVATLAISERVRTYLEQRGAHVLMTRIAPGAVPLADRPVMARRADADAFVSIHLNAFPDGVNPFTHNGTGTYYFNAFSEPLARTVQDGMVRAMGLRDLGVNYDNLAVLRPTWMPSVLCEGAFLMIPAQEAALRTPGFQDAYARGVVEGLTAYFRALGAG